MPDTTPNQQISQGESPEQDEFGATAEAQAKEARKQFEEWNSEQEQ